MVIVNKAVSLLRKTLIIETKNGQLIVFIVKQKII